ncbi:protein of unknown function [bacterium A37T11]|nr:protein of unknown function [bacterium A37T11]
MKKAILYIAAVIIGQSCRKEATQFYSGDQGVFFKNGENHAEVDFGAIREFVNDTIVWVPIYLFGNNLNQPSSYLLQTDESSTAVAGRDYILPASYIFKPNLAQDSVSIHMLRSPAIHDDTLTIVLHLIPNTNFPGIWQDGEDQEYATIFKITTSDHIDKPDDWDHIADYYGIYSDKKLRLIISLENQEYTVENILNILKFQADAKSYKLKKYLKEQQAAGTPVYEVNGMLMQAGPKAPDRY